MLIGVGEHIWWNTTQFIGVHSVNFTETTPNFCVIQTTWVQNPNFDLNFLGIWTLQNYPRLKSLAWEPMTWDEYYFIDFKLIKVNYSRGSDRPDLEYRFGLLNGRSGRSIAQKNRIYTKNLCDRPQSDRKSWIRYFAPHFSGRPVQFVPIQSYLLEKHLKNDVLSKIYNLKGCIRDSSEYKFDDVKKV